MITFKRAVRENVPLVIGIAGPSGGGKTKSAMRIAAGIAGKKPFAVIDTESGRAKHYADQYAFDHADLQPPFRPMVYMEAIEAADKAGYPVIVVDSCSHEHAGEGGLLDWHEEELDRMAGQEWSKRESCKMAAWIKPKMAHKQMISRLLQVRAHVILCFRAEQKVEMVRVNGRTEIQPKKLASGFTDWIPICDKNMLYELTASFLLTPDQPGIPHPIKLQDQMRAFVDLHKPLDESVGRQLAAWAAGGKQTPTETSKPERVPDAVAEESASSLPDATAALQGDDAAPYLVKVGRQKNAPVYELTDENLAWVLNYYQTKLQQQPESRYRDEWEEAILALQAEKDSRRGYE